jgi:hypothetical protein
MAQDLFTSGFLDDGTGFLDVFTAQSGTGFGQSVPRIATEWSGTQFHGAHCPDKFIDSGKISFIFRNLNLFTFNV